MKKGIKEETIRNNANKIRAEILGHAIEVEDLLTEALGHIYCPTNNKFYVHRIVQDILTDLTFDRKIRIFKKFVELLSESFDHDKKIIENLNLIREKRNQLAHSNLLLPWIFDENDLNEDGYNFLTKEYKNWKESCEFTKAGKNTFTITVKELENYKRLCEFTIISISIGMNK